MSQCISGIIMKAAGQGIATGAIIYSIEHNFLKYRTIILAGIVIVKYCNLHTCITMSCVYDNNYYTLNKNYTCGSHR